MAMYSIITYLTATKMIDYIVDGIDAFTELTVISGESEKVRSYIIIGTVISISMAIVTALLILSIVWTSFFI